MSQTEYTQDSIGRKFCKEHHREICPDCCLGFDISNRIVEEKAGLIRSFTKEEGAAAVCILAESSLEDLERFGTEEQVSENRKMFKHSEALLRCFATSRGNHVESARRRAVQELENMLMNQRALMQARARCPMLEAESLTASKKRIYWSVASPPPIDSDRADLYTCAYCRKISPVKLMHCARCKKSSYCTNACQKVCWKVHKKECIAADKGALSLPLTWAQLEAHGGRPVEGETLELRAILDVTSTMRQVFICKDRIGDVMQVAAYTTSRSLHPDLKQGSIIKWKNPRFHYFNRSSGGARIEDEDLVNITVTN